MIVGLGVLCACSIFRVRSCGDVLMPLLLGTGIPSKSGVDGIKLGLAPSLVCQSAFCWREFGSRVGCVSVMEDGFLECVNIKSGDANDQPFDFFFDSYLSSAVVVGKCDRDEVVVDSPIM